MNKKGVEWYYLVILIVLIASIAVISLFYSGLFPRLSESFNKIVLGAV